MKKFIEGFLCGVLATFLVLFLISIGTGRAKLRGVTMLKEPVEFTEANRFVVIQVLPAGALCWCSDENNTVLGYPSPPVYVLADGENQFYDEQTIDVPKGKKAIQVGTYQYRSNDNMMRTVPVLQFQ